MTPNSCHPATCRISFPALRDGERKTIACYLNLARERIPACASISLNGKGLEIRGTGYDGRCAFCRYLRKALAKHAIPFACTCPLEARDGNGLLRVKIGSAFFSYDLLEDKEKYLLYLHRAANNPGDLEAWLALGVINEHHGRFVPALSGYWNAFLLDSGDAFIKERLRDILSLLQQVIDISGK